MEALFKIIVAGVVINSNREYLLVKPTNTDGKAGKWTYPSGELKSVEGAMWEIMEDQLAKIIYAQTGIEIADGPIPFTNQAFPGKDGFEHIMQLFICKYRFGKPVVGDNKKLCEIAWKKYTELIRKEFEPLNYLVFEKAEQFITKLNQ